MYICMFVHFVECVGDFDAAIAAQAAGFMPHEGTEWLS